jgi:amidase
VALAGLCFTVKAELRTGVLPATAGSLLVDARPGRPAPVVDRLRRAGALLVGATNCAEFALSPSAANRRYGQTTNPVAAGWTLDGSSAECAAAVGGGPVPLRVGTDYGRARCASPRAARRSSAFRPARSSVPGAGQEPTAAAGSPGSRFSVPGLLTSDVATLAAAVPVFLGRPVLPRPPSRVAWIGDDDDWEADAVVVSGTREVADRLGGQPVEVFGPSPLHDAGVDLRPHQGDRRPGADSHPRRCSNPGSDRPPAVDPRGAPQSSGSRRRCAGGGAPTERPTVSPALPASGCGGMTTPAPPAGAETPFGAPAPSRAVSFLGVAALSVPAGVTAAGAPIGVQLIGSAAVLQWAAERLSR